MKNEDFHNHSDFVNNIERSDFGIEFQLVKENLFLKGLKNVFLQPKEQKWKCIR